MPMEKPEVQKEKSTVLPKKEKEFKTKLDSLDKLNLDMIDALKKATVHFEEPTENIGNLNPSPEEIAKFNEETREKELEEYRDQLTLNGKEIKFTEDEEREFQDKIKKLEYDRSPDKKQIKSNAFSSISTFKVPEKITESEEERTKRTRGMGAEIMRDMHPNEVFDPKYYPKPEDPRKHINWFKKLFSLDEPTDNTMLQEESSKRLLDKEKNKMEQAPKTPEQELPPIVPNNEGRIDYDVLDDKIKSLGINVDKAKDIIPDAGANEQPQSKTENIPVAPITSTLKSSVVDTTEAKTSEQPKITVSEEETKHEQEFLAKVKKQQSGEEKGPINTFTDAFKNLTERPPKKPKIAESPVAPKAEKAKPSTPEAVEKMTKKAEGAGISTSPLERFNIKNQSLWSRMKEGARNIAMEIYDKAIKFPVQKTLAKMGIGYNEYMADWNEKTAVKFKEQMDAIEKKKGVYDSTKKEMESLIVELKGQGLPGSESLQIKLRDIEDQKRKLDNKKDTIQSKFEYYDSMTRLWTEKRDNIADRLISNYDEKLKPMEGKLDYLKSCQDELDIQESVTKIEHDRETAKLNDLSQRIEKIETGLKLVGTDSSEIRKILKPLTEQVLAGSEKIKLAKEELKNKRMAINTAIVDADEKANPYRDNREQFVRIKDRRPIDMNVEKRKTGKVFDKNTVIEGGTRKVNEMTESETEEDSEIEKAEAGAVPPVIQNPENIKNTTDRLKTSTLINSWNEYLKSKNIKDGILVPAEFMKLTKMSDKIEPTEEEFKTVLTNYLKFKKIPNTNLKGFSLKKK